MPDSFDPDLDKTFGEEPTPDQTLYEYGNNGEAYVLVTLANRHDYALAVKAWTWEGDPLVAAGDGSLVTPSVAAAELEYQLSRLPPVLSMAQHRDLAGELDAVVEQLDELATELREHRDGQALMFAAMEAAETVSALELELSTNACTHHPTEPNVYGLRGLAKPPRCRCGLTPDCLRPIPEDV